MANFATLAAEYVVSLFTASAGTDFALNAISQNVAAGLDETPPPPIQLASVLVGNCPPEFLEQSLALKYPTVNVFCDKLANTLKEKFRVFSGTAQVTIELRHSQDHVQNVQPGLESYVTAACQILDDSRGDWGNGLFYRGGYEVSFLPLKRGGKDFLQIARVALQLDISA